MSLDFTININGNFAGALEKGNKALGETEKKAHEAEKAFEAFEGELGRVQAGALRLNFNAFQEGGHFLQFDLAEAAALAYEAIEKLVDGVIDLGKEILHASGAAEDLNLAIKLDVGDEGLEKVSALAESFRGTRFDDKAIKTALLPILEESGDEHAGQWDDLITAATDVATRRNTGVAGAKSALDALRSIEIQPQKVRGALKELGIKQVDFYSDLGDLLGISAKTAEAQTKAGKVKAQTLLSVALNQIAQREGGSLGNATNEGQKTLGTSLERLANLKENLFEGLAGSPGLKEFQGAIDTFVNMVGGPLGQKALTSLDGLFGAVGRFASSHASDAFVKVSAALDSMASVIDGTNETWNKWMRIFDLVSDGLTMALRPFTLVRDAIVGIEVATIDALVSLVSFFDGIFSADSWGARWDIIADGLGSLFHRLTGFMYDATIGIGVAMYDGIVGGAGRAIDAVINRLHPGSGTGAPQLPAYADGGIVDHPTIALIGEDGPEAVVPLGKGGASRSIADIAGGGSDAVRGGSSFSIGELHLHVSGDGKGGKEILDDAGQSFRAEASKWVDEMRASMGVG
jgi:hypothetical protein